MYPSAQNDHTYLKMQKNIYGNYSFCFFFFLFLSVVHILWTAISKKSNIKKYTYTYKTRHYFLRKNTITHLIRGSEMEDGAGGTRPNSKWRLSTRWRSNIDKYRPTDVEKRFNVNSYLKQTSSLAFFCFLVKRWSC